MASVILAPLPQYTMEGCSARFEPTADFWLCPLSPEVRNGMLRAVPQEEATEGLRSLIVESETVAVSVVPIPKPVGSPMISGALYRAVADGVLRQVVDCLRLWADVPEAFDQCCWFVGETHEGHVSPHTLRVLDAAWQDSSVYDAPFDLADAIKGSETLWPVLVDFLGIARLIQTFRSPKKQKGYVAAGNAKVKDESIRLVEVAATESQATEPVAEPKHWNIPKKFAARWFFEGYMQAYLKAVRNLDQSDYAMPGASRFARAFQAFVASFRIDNPFRYVARTTCLEALLGLGNAELTFQLSARAAWLLYAESPKERHSFFQEVRDCYKLRSTIVHGSKYSLTDLSKREDQLLSAVRRIMQRILLSQALRSVYFSANSGDCDAFLKQLALGIGAPS